VGKFGTVKFDAGPASGLYGRITRTLRRQRRRMARAAFFLDGIWMGIANFGRILSRICGCLTAEAIAVAAT